MFKLSKLFANFSKLTKPNAFLLRFIGCPDLSLGVSSVHLLPSLLPRRSFALWRFNWFGGPCRGRAYVLHWHDTGTSWIWFYFIFNNFQMYTEHELKRFYTLRRVVQKWLATFFLSGALIENLLDSDAGNFSNLGITYEFK